MNAVMSDHRSVIPSLQSTIKNVKRNILRVSAVIGAVLVLNSTMLCAGAEPIREDVAASVVNCAALPQQGNSERQPPASSLSQNYKLSQTASKNKDGFSLIKQASSGFNEKEYRTCLKKIDQALEKKDFPKIAKKLIREGFYQIYKNYYEWHAVYKDLPSIQEYTKETLIRSIKNTKRIKAIREDSKLGKKLLKNGSALGFTSCDGEITLIYKNPKTASAEDHMLDLEHLFHELKHCKDRKFFKKLGYNVDEYGIELAIFEGGATFHMKFINPLSANNTTYKFLETKNGRKSINYGKDTGSGYMFDLYVYENLVYLAGYDTVESVGLGQSTNVIKKAISKKNGKDKAKAIWNGLLHLRNCFLNDEYQSDEVFEFAVNLQKVINECIRKDIKELNVNRKTDVKRFMEVYRNYKLKIMPRVLFDSFQNHTRKCFDIGTLDDLMVGKIMKSKAVDRISQNRELNKMALKAMLFADNDFIKGDSIVYYPSSIYGTTYKYREEAKIGYLYMQYIDPKGENVVIFIKFNKEKLLKTKCDPVAAQQWS